ncbi:CadD family cadmium resistance transporter [Paucilactobacillus wasatchensis]|uniref:CadD family cadmium resistance transporter n=1 Tax=Paucilactobacillus wasatchensis TaxID=1335616 RepID=UPI0005C5EA8F|nr:CadD family cadmium resistance transporter [Paucilactobacillus wasatchensis]
MLKTIITAIILYVSTSIDLLVILMLIFSKYRSPAHKHQIYIGQFLGSYTLILISIFFAFILHYVPAKWLLGFLGLIPIAFGISFLVGSEDEAAEARETIERRKNKNLIGTVLLITVASCGADNIGLFVPYFVSLTVWQLLITLVVFTFCIYLLVCLGDKFSQVDFVKPFLAKFGDWIMAIIYIGLGIMILWESDTIGQLIKLIIK